MFFTITNDNGDELKLSRPYGAQYGVQLDLKLNDGSDPTEVQAIFNQEQGEAIANAMGFFS